MSFIIVFVIAALLCGCSNSKNIQNNISGVDGQNNNDDFVETDKSSSERADIIKNEILQIKEISSATVVITGKSALIGITLNISSDDTEEVDRIKTETGKRTRSKDKGIENTAITINTEITQMIKDMEYQKNQWRNVSVD